MIKKRCAVGKALLIYPRRHKSVTGSLVQEELYSQKFVLDRTFYQCLTRQYKIMRQNTRSCTESDRFYEIANVMANPVRILKKVLFMQ